MKQSFNVYRRISEEADEGFITVYRIEDEEQFYEEAARFNLDLLDTEGFIIYHFGDATASAARFEKTFLISTMWFRSAQKALRLLKGRYVFVVKTEDGVEVSEAREYDPINDAPSKDDPRKVIDGILGRAPSEVLDTL